MAELKLVAVSGTVGVQVFASTKPVVLKSVLLTPSGANATVKIRDGAAPVSAEIVLFGRAPSAYGSKQFKIEGGKRFDKGLHVTIIGANAQGYLIFE